jgi:hypothetical protein
VHCVCVCRGGGGGGGGGGIEAAAATIRHGGSGSGDGGGDGEQGGSALGNARDLGLGCGRCPRGPGLGLNKCRQILSGQGPKEISMDLWSYCSFTLF